MNLFASRLVAFILLFGLHGIMPATALAEPVTSELSASEIAVAAFLKDTKGEITDYDLRPGKHTGSEWCFFIDGKGKFLRPGNHWIVTVNRNTGGAHITYGL
jgi:hypothetical protein